MLFLIWHSKQVLSVIFFPCFSELKEVHAHFNTEASSKYLVIYEGIRSQLAAPGTRLKAKLKRSSSPPKKNKSAETNTVAADF